MDNKIFVLSISVEYISDTLMMRNILLKMLC